METENKDLTIKEILDFVILNKKIEALHECFHLLLTRIQILEMKQLESFDKDIGQ
jgi:hypothetical protein